LIEHSIEQAILRRAGGSRADPAIARRESVQYVRKGLLQRAALWWAHQAAPAPAVTGLYQ